MVKFPPPLQIEILNKNHNKKLFSSGDEQVDSWLKTKARQSQDKNISRTKVLVDGNNIVGFYSLVMYHVNFDELPPEINRKLPKTLVPAIKLAWLGVDTNYKGRGLGKRLLANALVDCYKMGQLIPFCAVILDCINSEIKSFYESFDFIEVPGHSLKMALSWKALQMMYES